ncbi:helix-turn-helix domain-containing protein [Streptomyces griseoincarnatus]
MSRTPDRVFSGRLFKQLRKERGVKGSTIARATGIPESTLSTWVHGHNTPTLEKLTLVADFMGLPVDAFLAPVAEVRHGSDA